jgi:hypothetical protein
MVNNRKSFYNKFFQPVNANVSASSIRGLGIEAVCPICGSRFIVPAENIYKHYVNHTYVNLCSYHCYLKAKANTKAISQREKRKKEIVKVRAKLQKTIANTPYGKQRLFIISELDKLSALENLTQSQEDYYNLLLEEKLKYEMNSTETINKMTRREKFLEEVDSYENLYDENLEENSEDETNED